MTVTVNALTATTLYRSTQLGATATEGGELIAGLPYEIVWNGSNWVISQLIQVGSFLHDGGTASRPGYLIANGGCAAQATYPDLYTVIGNTYGSGCGLGNFTLPQGGGTPLVGPDTSSYISIACANNLFQGSGANAPGSICGAQRQNIGQINLPPINLPSTDLSISDPGHSHTDGTSVGLSTTAGAFGVLETAGSGHSTSAALTGISIQGTVPLGGSSVPLATLPPVAVIGQVLIRF
jgi:hypothetical protein